MFHHFPIVRHTKLPWNPSWFPQRQADHMHPKDWLLPSRQRLQHQPRGEVPGMSVAGITRYPGRSVPDWNRSSNLENLPHQLVALEEDHGDQSSRFFSSSCKSAYPFDEVYINSHKVLAGMALRTPLFETTRDDERLAISNIFRHIRSTKRDTITSRKDNPVNATSIWMVNSTFLSPSLLLPPFSPILSSIRLSIFIPQ